MADIQMSQLSRVAEVFKFREPRKEKEKEMLQTARRRLQTERSRVDVTKRRKIA